MPDRSHRHGACGGEGHESVWLGQRRQPVSCPIVGTHLSFLLQCHQAYPLNGPAVPIPVEPIDEARRLFAGRRKRVVQPAGDTRLHPATPLFVRAPQSQAMPALCCRRRGLKGRGGKLCKAWKRLLFLRQKENSAILAFTPPAQLPVRAEGLSLRPGFRQSGIEAEQRDPVGAPHDGKGVLIEERARPFLKPTKRHLCTICLALNRRHVAPPLSTPARTERQAAVSLPPALRGAPRRPCRSSPRRPIRPGGNDNRPASPSRPETGSHILLPRRPRCHTADSPDPDSSRQEPADRY